MHSCRYFSNDANTTVLVKAYVDIKWDFHFFLNLSNKLSVKWQNLSPEKHKEMQSKAGKIGAEKRWKQTEIDFGVAIDAKWDKIEGDKYNGHYDATKKYEKKSNNFIQFSPANKNNLGINNVIFHYGKIDPEIGVLNNEKNNVLGMYQINLYTKFESDELYNNLKLLFGKPKNTYSLGPINTTLWINNNICYYYFTKDNDDFYRVLFVYKKNDKE